MIRINSPGGLATAEQIGRVLGKVAQKVTQRTPARWKFSLANGQILQATAEVDDGWLLMRVPVRAGRRQMPANADQLWGLLRSNASLPGGAKYAVDDGGRLSIRAEIPTGEEVDLGRRVWNTCQGIKMASARIAARQSGGSPEETLPTESDSANGNPPQSTCDLQRLCKELQWKFVARSSGSLAVELDVPGSFCQALIDQRPSGLHLWVNVGEMDSSSATCREAFGLLLLTANYLVRMARTTVLEQNDRVSAVFEIVLDPSPAAVEIDSALSALSVACRLCGQEVRILQDDSIAKVFLRSRGWSS